MVFFSVVSIPMLIPFLEIMLGQEKIVHTPPAQVSSVDELIQYFYYSLSQVITEFGQERALIYMCMCIVVIYFFRNLFRYLSMFFMAPARNGIVRDLRQQLFEKTMVLPMAYFTEERKGDLLSRITADVQEIEWSILNVLEVIFRAPFMIIGSLIMMIYISPSLTMFAFVLLLFTVVVIGGVGKALKKQSSEVQDRLGRLVTGIDEGLSGLKIIKGLNARAYQQDRFKKENDGYKDLLTRLLWRRDLASPLSEFLGVATVAVLIWYGFQEVQDGNLTPATFITFLYAFFSIIDPAKSFSKASYSIQKGMASMERVERILDADMTIEEIENPIKIQSFEKSIEFKNVDFQYKNSETLVLNKINLSIPKGKVIALVGASGGGKSTLVDMLPRFYDVTNGAVEIDGINIKDFQIKSLRSLMGIVTQESVLFNDSIYENIVFGLKNVSKQDVIAAAKIANAHEFIMASPEGYETNIGDRGTKLSGGQRQRLTIARAILRNPPILILDEATSALDAEAEQLVQQALGRIMQDRTAIVIAHRLTTIQYADEIIVLDNGQIIEQGTHEYLLTLKGAYYKLIQLQAL